MSAGAGCNRTRNPRRRRCIRHRCGHDDVNHAIAEEGIKAKGKAVDASAKNLPLQREFVKNLDLGKDAGSLWCRHSRCCPPRHRIGDTLRSHLDPTGVAGDVRAQCVRIPVLRHDHKATIC